MLITLIRDGVTHKHTTVEPTLVRVADYENKVVSRTAEYISAGLSLKQAYSKAKQDYRHWLQYHDQPISLTN